jgi:ketosteroid isomerase-like protein
MSESVIETARRGLAAWRRGDFEAMESILDPGVEWRWFEPGEWDCNNRTDVMRTLKERYEQGFSAGELEFSQLSQDAVVVVAHPAAIGGDEWPDETATILWFKEGRVVEMQDYRTHQEALEAAAAS